jgi:serine/threonine protein kinase
MVQTSQAIAPRTIGKYQVLSLLAEGGMSTVYKGHDPATGATVAIKLGDAELTKDPVLLKRFEQEFRATNTLHHPNIVRGLEFGWAGPRPYIVMEFVDGGDMWSRIDRKGRLGQDEAVGYIVQVARALHEAHGRGIIHRDIKPDNILLTKSGQAKLTDLGLSKDLESDCELTRPSRGIGTPNFIAPEQFGDARHAGVRCDVYSLGATLCMALTGQVPFAAATLSAVLKKKLANDFTSPRQLVPAISAHVDGAIRRAMMADPEQRHASCLEFIAALTTEDGVASASTGEKSSPPASWSGSSAGATYKERRTAARFDCALSTSCTINQSLHNDATAPRSQWDAQVCNLSVNGIALLLPRRFEPGSVLTVNLTSGDGDVTRTRDIRVVRVARAEGCGWFLAGKLTESLSKEELGLLL